MTRFGGLFQISLRKIMMVMKNAIRDGGRLLRPRMLLGLGVAF